MRLRSNDFTFSNTCNGSASIFVHGLMLAGSLLRGNCNFLDVDRGKSVATEMQEKIQNCRNFCFRLSPLPLTVNMSEQHLKISSLVVERLSKIQNVLRGQIFGVIEDNIPSVLGFSVSVEENLTNGESENVAQKDFCIHDILSNLPANIVILGSFLSYSSEDENIKWEKENLKSETELNSLLLNVDLKKHLVEAKIRKEDKYEKVEYQLINDCFYNDFIHVRLNGTITISCDFNCESVQDAILLIRKKINQGVAFQLKNTDIFLLENGIDGVKFVEAADVDELIHVTKDSSSKKNSNFNNNTVLNFSMYLKSCANSSDPEFAPMINYVKKSFKSMKINLSLDTLGIVNKRAGMNKLYKILLESVRRNLTLNENCLVMQFMSSDASKISLPKIHHFFPKKCGHFMSIAYPKKQTEDELVGVREAYHRILSLPMDMPIFRRGHAFSFAEKDDNPGTIIINPHEGLDPSGVANGEVSVVQGLYSYHHYMQDGFDDSGWGCAYRSLQTIFSWFRHQGYTGRSIPSHREIQQCLVDIGDKPASFVGSRNWIGSTEVSFVLDTLLGVSSRIVSVSSGEELSMKGGELSHHFKTQGTPIMIGGGVLAHTILGVDYNRKTGALKFLILDPHYTGEEDLSVVQSKGWCGWKDLSFWKKNAFYNMCLPLRPKSV